METLRKSPGVLSARNMAVDMFYDKYGKLMWSRRWFLGLSAVALWTYTSSPILIMGSGLVAHYLGKRLVKRSLIHYRIGRDIKVILNDLLFRDSLRQPFHQSDPQVRLLQNVVHRLADQIGARSGSIGSIVTSSKRRTSILTEDDCFFRISNYEVANDEPASLLVYQKLLMNDASVLLSMDETLLQPHKVHMSVDLVASSSDEEGGKVVMMGKDISHPLLTFECILHLPHLNARLMRMSFSEILSSPILKSLSISVQPTPADRLWRFKLGSSLIESILDAAGKDLSAPIISASDRRTNIIEDAEWRERE